MRSLYRTLLLTAIFSLVLCFASCSGKGASHETTASTVTPAAASSSPTEKTTASTVPEETFPSGTVDVVFNGKYRKTLDFGDYIKLGDYKGLKIEYYGYSYEDILRRVMSLGDGVCEEKREGTVGKNDTVVIDFEARGLNSGNVFLSDNDYIWNTGTGELFDLLGLDLTGKSIGSEVKATLTFPEDYFNDQYKGVKADFTVKIKYVKTFTHPEVDDAFIEEYTSGEFKSVQSYAEYLYEEEKKTSSADRYFEAVLSDVTSRGLNYDEEIAASLRDDLKRSDEELASQLRTTPAGYYGLTDEAYEERLTSLSKEYFTRTVLLYAVAYLESIPSPAEEEVRAFAEEKAASLGVTAERYIEDYGEESIKEALLYKKAAMYLVGTADFTEPTVRS